MRRENTYVEGRRMNRLQPSAFPPAPAFYWCHLR